MPKSSVHRFLIWLLRSLRIAIMAWMIGIANSINQESRFMDEPQHKIEVVEKEEDDEPID